MTYDFITTLCVFVGLVALASVDAEVFTFMFSLIANVLDLISYLTLRFRSSIS